MAKLCRFCSLCCRLSSPPLADASPMNNIFRRAAPPLLTLGLLLAAAVAAGGEPPRLTLGKTFSFRFQDAAAKQPAKAELPQPVTGDAPVFPDAPVPGVGGLTEAEKLEEGESELTDDALTVDIDENPLRRAIEEVPAEGEPAAGLPEDEELVQGESQLTDDSLTVGADVDMKVRWNNGLEFMSTNREFRVHVGGRAQFDTTSFTAGPGVTAPPSEGGVNQRLAGATNFRRGRFRIDGQMYENFEWLTEFDFINQLQVNSLADPSRIPQEQGVAPNPAPTEVWLAITQLPYVGNLVVGNQNTLTGLEHITSDRFVNFMERSFNADAFTMPFNNAYAPGIQIFNNWGENDRYRWALGTFKDDFNIFGFSDTAAANSIQTRITGLVVDDPDNNRWTHLGFCAVYQQTPQSQDSFRDVADPVTGAISQQVTQQGSMRYRVRGNIRNGPPGPLNSIYADTGLLGASYQTLLTAEYASNWGPLQMQAEWTMTLLPKARSILNPSGTAGQQPIDTVVENLFYQGAYVEVMYALTGEGRSYNRKQAVLDRYVPRNNFYRVRTPDGIRTSEGGVQIGARYDWVCLNDKGINGGVLNGLTLGANWFLNPNTRVALNYDFTYRNFINSLGANGSGGINGFGARFFYDF